MITLAEVLETFEAIRAHRQPRILAHHAVPYGRAYRQWNTAGELLIWVNRGWIHDLPRKPAESLSLEFVPPSSLGARVEYP